MIVFFITSLETFLKFQENHLNEGILLINFASSSSAKIAKANFFIRKFMIFFIKKKTGKNVSKKALAIINIVYQQLNYN